MKAVHKIILYFNLILVGLTLLAYLSPFVNPSAFWLLSFFGLIVPLLLLINGVFVFYWMITRWRFAWVSLACLLLGAPYLSQILAFSSNSPGEDYDFSLATYNMNYAYGTYKKGTYRHDQQKTAAFESFIENELNADILCAQESNKYIRDLLVDFYPYRHVLENAGTSIYSKCPLVGKGQIDFGTKTNSCVWADLKIAADTVRVYSAHLQSNKISSEADQILHDAESKKHLNLINIRSIFSKYKHYVGIRSEQARQLKDHMVLSPYPVILAGDLNDPPVSYTHRILSRNKKDAFVEAGNGLGVSYAGNIPLLRIDNILLAERFEVLDYQTIRKKFSDHYPVVCKINIP